MGLGKTVQFIALLAALRLWPALIVVQPHLMQQWVRELARFLPNARVAVLTGLTPTELPDAHIHVIHYGLLRGWGAMLAGKHLVIGFDELQELRHLETLKYSAASTLAETPNCVIGLSGTPIHNYGGEIWAVLNILELHCLGDYDSFSREWCDGYRSKVVRDPELLGARLREEGLLLRRTKQEVLPELPPKRRVIEEIDAEEGQFGELVAEAARLAKKFSGIKDVLERGRTLRYIVQSARQATGVAKAPYVAEFVAALLEAGESVLLFAHHHRVVELLEKALRKWQPAVLTGMQSKTEKDEAVQRFQAGKTPVCIVSMRVCAGLNLQAAHCVVFAELDWSPAVHAQAEDRAHRMGQSDSVLAYYLIWHGQGSSDPQILDRLGIKTSQFISLMGDHVVTEEDKLLNLKAAQEHMLAIVALLSELPASRRRHKRNGR